MSEDLIAWLRATMGALESDARAFLELHPDLPDWPNLALAEIEAKRRILEHRDRLHQYADPTKHPAQEYVLAAGASDVVARLLALPYADEPGYRQEWRP